MREERGLRVLPKIPSGIWVLGFVSMLMDVSSELIHSLLPVFMVSSLGASAAMVGLVEGVAESTALIVKIFSGTLSDYFGKRKALTLLGYGLGALSKPFFALAQSVPLVLAARFVDRIGKGVRGAPRDALIADITPPSIRGAAYGLRQSLDTVGAFLGPVLAIWLMVRYSGRFRDVFWIATLPACAAVVLLAIGVREPETPTKKARLPIHWRTLTMLSPEYWHVVAVGGIFTLARFSEAFLILRAHERGLSNSLAPGVLIAMNVVYACTAYPAGWLADRVDRRALLAAGLLSLIAADLLLARAAALPLVAVGVALWGLHMGLTQGIFAALIADSAPDELRGTAFGVFNFVGGIAMLAASVLAGALWDKLGPAATFYTGAVFAAAALLLLVGGEFARRRPADGRS